MEWVKMGWSNNGRRDRDGGGKRRGSTTTPHEVPSNFSAVVVLMTVLHLNSNSYHILLHFLESEYVSEKHHF